MRITRHFLALPCVLFLSCKKNDSNNNQPATPTAVTTSFATSFPNATNLEWERVGSNYEAEFNVNNAQYDALLNASGTVLMYKYDLAITALPAAVQASIARSYPGLRIDEAEQLYTNATATTTFYQVEIDAPAPQADYKLVYSAAGQSVTQPAYWAD